MPVPLSLRKLPGTANHCRALLLSVVNKIRHAASSGTPGLGNRGPSVGACSEERRDESKDDRVGIGGVVIFSARVPSSRSHGRAPPMVATTFARNGTHASGKPGRQPLELLASPLECIDIDLTPCLSTRSLFDHL